MLHYQALLLLLQIIVTYYLWHSAKFLESMFMRTDKMMPVLCPDGFFITVAGAGERHTEYPGTTPFPG